MTQEQIIEGNKSIDEFMDNWLANRGFSEIELNYNSDYGTLMPVVEKIQKMRVKFNNPKMEYGLTLINAMDRWLYVQHKSLSKIEAVWLAVVEFIKWYNANGKIELIWKN